MNKITYVEGDLLASGERVIAHGCNAQGVMKSGIAKAIRAQYPIAYTLYKNRYDIQGGYLEDGDVIPVQAGHKIILNIISQRFYGRDPDVVYVNYDAIMKAIVKINTFGFERVAFPKIGAGLANGDWSKISNIIETYADFSPYVYYL